MNYILLNRNKGYRHYKSYVTEFYKAIGSYSIISVNNHVLNIDEFEEDFRLIRLVRDPRDLIVSGYFYHKSGKESWCNVINPDLDTFKVVNGCIPEILSNGMSFSESLKKATIKEGLLAEIEFRANHFDTMRKWGNLKYDKRILLIKYEDLVKNPFSEVKRIFNHMEYGFVISYLGATLGWLLSSSLIKHNDSHVRSSTNGDWKEYFTEEVQKQFLESHKDLLEMYGY